ncbi:hypothetical protein [Kineosporia babensis]|uniref:Lipoprotein n=1 Tax=Kineosporia babensis TaxID=499548 RepID=A0A9X1NHJ7_9ACTN|nr:hypothetical protein [Kineosporia babensis]MCD5313233.1 hypothetical protein [Kineosporia babensis]
MTNYRATALTTASLLVAALSACSSAKGAAAIADDVARESGDVVRVADNVFSQSDDLARVGRYRPVPKTVIPAQPVVEQRMIAILQTHLADLPVEDAQQVVALACQAKDWYEVGQASSASDAAWAVTVNYGGNLTFRYRVQGLAAELQSQNGMDAVGVFAVFAICELA